MKGYLILDTSAIYRALDAFVEYIGDGWIISICGNAEGNIVIHHSSGDAYIYNVVDDKIELVKNWREKIKCVIK